MSGSASAIVVAGGTGERFGRGGGKQLARLAGRPVLAWSLLALDASPLVTEIVLVCPADRTAEYLAEAVEPLALSTPLRTSVSGDTRLASVESGLAHATGDIVLVHDGARPLITPALVADLVDALLGDPLCDGVVPGHSSVDTLKVVSDGLIESTPDRARLWAVQTPQVFRSSTLRAAFAAARVSGFSGTDDASFVEHAGGRVRVIPGPRDNFKVTLPEDALFAEALLRARMGE